MKVFYRVGLFALVIVVCGAGTINAEDASFGRAPGEGHPPGEPGTPMFRGSIAHGINLTASPDTLTTFDVDVPGTFTTIGGVASYESVFAADTLPGDDSTLYAIDNGTNDFFSVDVSTGTVTVIGTATPTSGHSWTGLAGAPDGTLYASSTTISASDLYTIDTGTGTATIVGTVTGAPALIGIAVDDGGAMYGLDIVNDELVSIDPATAAGAVVGPIGFNANYAQGMDFDPSDGTLYLAAYGASGELRTADTATGATTLVGAFENGDEIDGLAFAGGGGPVGPTPVPGVPGLDHRGLAVLILVLAGVAVLLLRRRT